MTADFFVAAVGLAAGVVSGLIGTGSSIILLPILVYAFGPKQAVPIMAMAALLGNLAKVLAWWREVDWRACAAYALPGIPAAALGARTLLLLNQRFIDGALGLFFLVMIPTHHWLRARNVGLKLWQLALVGAFVGYLTGIVISTGPLSVPAFVAYGLTKGAFLSTEAMSSLFLFMAKTATFRALGALPPAAILRGLLVGAAMMIGTFAGKALVRRLSFGTYGVLLDVLLLGSGLALVWTAIEPAAP